MNESLRLTNIYYFYFGNDELLENAHTSEADVLMCEKIYDRMTKEVCKNE